MVIGGNYVGLEMGQLFARLGARVTILEVLERLAPLEEPEVSAWITKVFRNEGIEAVTSARITRVERTGDGRVVHLDDGRRLEAREVLVATGRRPNTEGLGLEEAGVELTERGAVRVDDELRTSNPRAYAAGDVTALPSSCTPRYRVRSRRANHHTAPARAAPASAPSTARSPAAGSPARMSVGRK